MLTEVMECLRRMSRRPGTYLLAAVTISVGIATALTMFAVVDSVLLRPFPFKDQDRLVTLWSTDLSRGVPRLEIAWYELEQYRADSRSFSDFAAYSAANNSIVVKRRGDAVQLRANIVSRDFLPMLGVRASRGRTFTDGEHKPDGPGVAMLSHAAWVRLFGADPALVGEALESGGQPFQIVGILPPHLDLPDDADVIFPLETSIPDEDSRNARVLTGLAKLRDDATLDQGRAELATIAARIESDRPESNKGIGVAVFPLVGELLGSTRPALKLLLAMGIALLMIAFSNVANVFLTRAVARGRELSVRVALGATRGRLLRQAVFESAIVTLCASAVGLVLAYIGLALLARFAPEDLPRLGEIGVSATTYAVLVGIALVVCVGLALFSSARSRRLELSSGAWGAGGRASLPRRTRAVLDGVVVLQVALTLLLLVAAGSLAQAFISMTRIDVGFRKENVVTAHVPRGYTFQQQPQRRLYFEQLFERVHALPGVEDVGSVLMRPLEMEQGWDFPYTVQGQGIKEHEDNPLANLLSATPGYFEAMGISLRAGRTFGPGDKVDSPKVAVISESFARRLGGVGEALGRSVKGGNPESKGSWFEIVGVVADVRYRAMTTEKFDIYVPYTQCNWSPNYIAVRTSGDPSPLIASLRTIARELDPDAPLSSVRTTAQLVDAKLAQPKLNASILALFAATAVFLAFVGLYGLLSYVMSLRRQELGVRLCLGATPAGLRRMVLRESLRITVAGVVLGGVATMIVASAMSRVGFGLGSIDERVLGGAALGLTLVCVIAALGPALRATHVDPAVVLRSE